MTTLQYKYNQYVTEGKDDDVLVCNFTISYKF